MKINKTEKVKVYIPSNEEIEQAKTWSKWTKEPSIFEWYYSSREKFYVVEGEVEVTLDDGETIEIKPGDMVIFEKGVKCIWNIKKAILKYYTFE